MRPPRHIKGGRINPKNLPRGPNGRACCRQCNTEVPLKRRTFCSQRCVDLWVIRTGSGAARFLQKRDKGVCAICSLDCAALRRQYRKLLTKEARAEFKARYGIPKHRNRRFWDIDHIIPVIEGGGDCGPENLRTVCISCHRVLTAQLAAKRAQERRKSSYTTSEL
jgi:5-methylcytosine-specific restriction enzyme A